MPTCDSLMVQKNTKEKALNESKRQYKDSRQAYLSCQGPSAVGAGALEDAQADLDKLELDKFIIKSVERPVLKQLSMEAQGQGAVAGISEFASEEIAAAKKEIEELRSEIRKERRLFLDADPSAPTSVAGLYYTKEPDNQLLIAFMSCFGAFLVLASVLIFMRAIPIPFLMGLDNNGMDGIRERASIVGPAWLVIIAVTYYCFYVFT